MSYNASKKEWDIYCAQTLAKISPILKNLGYTLDNKQPAISGERFLTRPITSGRKLVLVGRNISDETKVIIKVSDEKLGTEEIEHERICRNVLDHIQFAHQTLLSPKEILFIKKHGFTILITEFIEQERTFVSRELSEQFAFALKAFKAQESAHATTNKHRSLVTKTFGEMTAKDYLDKAGDYVEDVLKLTSSDDGNYENLEEVLREVISVMHENKERIEQYCGFLTHWDFTPQNFRIQNGKLFLLDHSSLRFGNKYEGWARFINFMVLYNPPLERALIKYVRDNRTLEESESLKLMRLFRLVELIRYYASWLSQTTGDLHELAKVRIVFWTSVLRATLNEKEVSSEMIDKYKLTRDKLRTEEELRRQENLH